MTASRSDAPGWLGRSGRPGCRGRRGPSDRLSRSGRLGWLAALGSLIVLIGVWLFGPAVPPIYDGLPIGTPPYRYLVPPKGSPHTPPPDSVSQEIVLADFPSGVTLATREPKPQADVSIPTQLLIVPTGVTVVRVTVAPIFPPAVPPKDGRIDGNLYRVAVTTLSGQPLQLKPDPDELFQVQLLGTGSLREPYVEEYVGASWVRVPFVHPQSGIFQFHPGQPGEFALVLPPSHSVFGPGLTAALTIGGALVMLAVLLGWLRHRRSRAWADAAAQEGGWDLTEGGEEGVE